MIDIVSEKACAWCNGSDDEYPEFLCLLHAAEYEGLSVDQYEKRDRIQYAEYLDTLG